MKIFQIGFNKCGTNSIKKILQNTDKNLSVIHWDRGLLAKKIYDNIQNKKSLLFGYENYDVFCDMECFFLKDNKTKYFPAFILFEEIDKQYPNSKFILNTRNKENWIKSRLQHIVTVSPIQGNHYKILEQHQLCFYWEKMADMNGVSKEQLIKMWEVEWDQHHYNVEEYFKNRSDDLLVFDIEKDEFSKFKIFFKNCNIFFYLIK